MTRGEEGVDEERITIRRSPQTTRHSRRMVCPHCDQRLPIDSVTECDECGAHLAVLVRTVAPPIGE